MSIIKAHHADAEPCTLPYRNTDNDTFKKIAQSTPCLPVPMSSQLPSSSHSSSCYVFPGPETASALDSDISTAGINSKHRDWHWHPGHTSTAYDYVHHDRRRDDYRYGWEFSAPACGYRDDTHVAGYPLGHPLPPSRFVRPRGGMLNELLPRIRAYGTLYTDDARMRLGDRIRRQCFNCQATETTTWRHSTLSPGKLLCNKCGLFERTHAIPRPKSFPRRRRSRPTSVDLSVGLSPAAFGSEGHYHYNGPPSNMPFTSPSPNIFSHGAIGGAATTSQYMSWMTHDMPHVSPTAPHIDPPHSATESPEIYREDFLSLSTVTNTATCPSSPS